MSRIKKTKEIKVIDVFTVEDHHEVVPHIHRAIGSKILPFEDLAMVHFDSHPDLLIPVDMPADLVFEKEELYSTLSIENWIIPLVYAGHINEIFWIKPYWSAQITDKIVTFLVGKCKETGVIRTTCKESYFVSELLYMDADKLENTKHLTLTVLTIEKNSHKSQTAEECAQNNEEGPEFDEIMAYLMSSKEFEYMKETLKKKKFILDVDLDFYSTKNPFKDVYSLKQYKLLKELYSCAALTDSSDFELKKYIEIRKSQLSDLKNLLSEFEADSVSHVDVNTDSEPVSLQEVSSVIKIQDASNDVTHSKRFRLVQELMEDIKSHNVTADVDLIHEAGCTIDDSELPHHISSTEEITQLVQITKNIIELLPRPSLITLSRSSMDDYCPPDQVQYIEESVYMILEESYVYVLVKRMYESSSNESVEDHEKQ